MKPYNVKSTKEQSVVTITQNSEDCTIHQFSNELGDIKMTGYKVFSGIHLIYNDVHIPECTDIEYDERQIESVFEINHCREGRIECVAGDKFFYLAPGDLSIHRKSLSSNSAVFPSSHYHGITVLIDTLEAPKCLSCILGDINVEPYTLMQKFLGDNNFFVARSNDHLEHIFSELYNLPKEIQRGYFKIKVLEIMLFLSCFQPEKTNKNIYTQSQVFLAKEVCKFLTTHMNQHITIENLAQQFHVSATYLKKCFRGVYGESIYGYIRTQKMQSASFLLKTTDKTILEIANLHGYENGSKFSAAFKTVMGILPKEYRLAMQKNNI